MEISLHLSPFCYKNKTIVVQRTPVWLVLSPERLSNTFPETGRGAGVAFASVLCGSHHRNKGTFPAGTLRPAGAAPMSPRAQDFTGHQDLPMRERQGNTHSSAARTFQTSDASSANHSLCIPKLINSRLELHLQLGSTRKQIFAAPGGNCLSHLAGWS